MGETEDLRLSLPSGAPAAGAEIGARSDPGDVRAQAIWSGRADDDGRIGVPKTAEGAYLLIRHPEAAFLIRHWPPTAGTPVAWTLPPSAPMTIHSVGANGESVPGALLGLEAYGHRLSSSLLNWLTYSAVNSTDQRGLWEVQNFPGIPVTVWTWKGRANHQRFLDGALDSQSTSVGYPRPSLVRVVVAE